MMFKKLIITTVVLMSALTSAYAAEVKIGVFDMRQVISKVPQTNLIAAKLEASFKDRLDELKALRDDGLKQTEAYNRDAMTLTEVQRISKQRALQKLRTDIKIQEKNLEEDYQRAQSEEIKKIQIRILQSVEKLAKAENFDVILRRESVAYRKNALDISNKLITILSDPAAG
ncbi:MAG: OmpH family outer membrane protein [Kangiellaceae bacterium]|nr:OmpH family outer membrane protein [Kangiellaceae bacterium]